MINMQTTTCVGGDMIVNGKRIVNVTGGPMTVVTNSEGTFVNGEKIAPPSAGSSIVQQNIGGVVYSNGRKMDESDTIHVGKAGLRRPSLVRVLLSPTAKVLLDSKEVEADELQILLGIVQLSHGSKNTSVPNVKRIDIVGEKPFRETLTDLEAFGDLSIKCRSALTLEGSCDRVETTDYVKKLELKHGCLQVTRVIHRVETTSGMVETVSNAPASTETPAAAILLVCEDADLGQISVDNCRTVQVRKCAVVNMSNVRWFFAVGQCNSIKTVNADVYIASGKCSTVETTSGRITLTDCDHAKSTSGDIKLVYCGHAETVSGDIFVDKSCEIAETVSGSIDVPEQCDARTTFGRIKRH